jgi:hypothetical protein
MSNHHPRGEPHQHHRLVERFDQRAARLRSQAAILLGIIIAVLVGGAAAFVFANDITRLTLQPQTAETQYAAVAAAIKTNTEKEAALDKQRNEIANQDAIKGPANEKVANIQDKYVVLEDNILTKCPTILTRLARNSAGSEIQDFQWTDDIKVRPMGRIGEYGFSLPSYKIVSFESPERANECKDQFVQHREEIIRYMRAIQDIRSEENSALRELAKNKEPALAPLNQSYMQLYNEGRRLDDLLKAVEARVIQEKVLGSPLIPEGRATSEKPDAKIDWARVIETNATRIGALATMFFLVTILVPQYRYNIRMASFYEARSDSFEILPDKMDADTFDKIVGIMTPNIDFGKAPPTPWEQIIEVIKTAKS